MKRGKLVNKIPFINVVVAWDQTVQVPLFVLDTGFSGSLAVNQEIAEELRLKIVSVTKAQVAGNQLMEVPTALVTVSMEGIKKNVDVLIMEGLPLVGIGLLTDFGYKAIVDCKNREVTIEKV